MMFRDNIFASTGKIDENKLFYLMSRGFSELEAKKLIIESSFNPITEKVPIEELRRKSLSILGGE